VNVFVRVFGVSFVVTGLALACAFLYDGTRGLLSAAMLGVLEVSLSFDNAIINATVLQRMSRFWQRMFLTVGVVVAVFGMRLLFPLAVVAAGAHLDPVQAMRLALNHPPTDYYPDHQPRSYAAILQAANPKIAAYGGAFLLMLFFDFIFTHRHNTWLTWLERPLAAIGRLRTLNVVIALLAVVLTGGYIAPDAQAEVVMASGMLGMITYMVVNGASSLLSTGGHGDTERHRPKSLAGAGLALFLYLELLDASFSFDGVIGAFAITSDPVIIALGLGLIGAMFVRSATMYLVRKHTLGQYIYLEHGAHWAIGVLAVILLISTGHHIDETVTGLVGVAIIAAAFASSVVHNHVVGRGA
jgi:hypothetical protein